MPSQRPPVWASLASDRILQVPSDSSTMSVSSCETLATVCLSFAGDSHKDPKVVFPGSKGTGILRVLHVPSSTQSPVKLLDLVSMASESTCHQLSSEQMWVTLCYHLVPWGPCQPVIPSLIINPWPCSVCLHLLQPRGPPEECSGHFWTNSV